mmetsp:Transcript_78815/g.170362  ORF Transcript_78815/g.170362 Transcript_78815/m.170362 type:complete len:202 (+) Transcript_78815:525-1130(+)
MHSDENTKYEQSCNKITDLNSQIEILKHTIQNLRIEVVEDPEETQRKKDDSKATLSDRQDDFKTHRAILSKNSEYLEVVNKKNQVASTLIKELKKLLNIVQEYNEYINKTKQNKTDCNNIKSEITHLNQNTTEVSKECQNSEDEYNRSKNTFEHDQKVKTIQIKELENRVNEVNESIEAFNRQYAQQNKVSFSELQKELNL